jgi:hypothetical protein
VFVQNRPKLAIKKLQEHKTAFPVTQLTEEIIATMQGSDFVEEFKKNLVLNYHDKSQLRRAIDLGFFDHPDKALQQGQYYGTPAGNMIAGFSNELSSFGLRDKLNKIIGPAHLKDLIDVVYKLRNTDVSSVPLLSTFEAWKVQYPDLYDLVRANNLSRRMLAVIKKEYGI